MNKTAKYDLPQWEENDPILRTDFNDFAAKVEAALAEQSLSNCQIKWTKKVGNGGPMMEFDTLENATLVFIFGGNLEYIATARNYPSYFLASSSVKPTMEMHFTWKDSSIQLYSTVSSTQKLPLFAETYYQYFCLSIRILP